MNVKGGQAALSDNEEETLVIDQSRSRQTENVSNSLKEQVETLTEEVKQQKMKIKEISEQILAASAAQKKIDLGKCCEICTKESSENGKGCPCRIKNDQRRIHLSTGCHRCGCFGCNKEDKMNAHLASSKPVSIEK